VDGIGGAGLFDDEAVDWRATGASAGGDDQCAIACKDALTPSDGLFGQLGGAEVAVNRGFDLGGERSGHGLTRSCMRWAVNELAQVKRLRGTMRDGVIGREGAMAGNYGKSGPAVPCLRPLPSWLKV
jgi:hypothetical protein